MVVQPSIFGTRSTPTNPTTTTYDNREMIGYCSKDKSHMKRTLALIVS
jgi:hypothetical protein